MEALAALLADETLRRDPDAEDAQGRTAAHFAAGLGSEECLRALVAVGADLGHREERGRAGTAARVPCTRCWSWASTQSSPMEIGRASCRERVSPYV